MSPGRFVLRPSAAANLDAIEDYLSENGSADIAAAFLESVTDAFRLLAGQPEMGRSWASSLPRLQDVRAWPLRIHQGYLLLYRPLTAPSLQSAASKCSTSFMAPATFSRSWTRTNPERPTRERYFTRLDSGASTGAS